MAVYTILARKADYSIVGPLRTFSMDATLEHNAVGSIALTIPVEVCPPGWPSSGDGIVVIRDGEEWASGSWDEEAFTWSADPGGEDGGYGNYTLTFDTDLGRILYRIVYPDPTLSWVSQQAPSTSEDPEAGAWYDRTSTNAETLLRDLVRLNAGPDAIVTRRVDRLVLGPLQAVGTSTTVHERFTPILDAMRTVASSGGGLGFNIVQDLPTRTLVFTVYATQDRSAQVHFSPELGNLSTIEAHRVAPTANAIQSAGGGQLKYRAMYEALDAASIAEWGRRETFRDQRQSGGGTDATEQEQQDAILEMEKDAAEAMTEGQEQGTFTATVIDTPSCTYGIHYNLGDTVSVGIDRTGFTVKDVVRAVKVEVDPTGVEQISISVGTTDNEDDTSWLQPVRDLTKRLSYLERAQ